MKLITRVIIVLIFLFIFGIIGAFCWPYTINTWLIYAGKEPAILWWHGFLFGFVPFLGLFSILGVFITYVLMLFLV